MLIFVVAQTFTGAGPRGSDRGGDERLGVEEQLEANRALESICRLVLSSTRNQPKNIV